MDKKNLKLIRNLISIAAISSMIMLVYNYTDQKRSLQTQNPLHQVEILDQIGSSISRGDIKIPSELKLEEGSELTLKVGAYDWLLLFAETHIDLFKNNAMPQIKLKNGRILFSLKNSAVLRKFSVGTNAGFVSISPASGNAAIGELLINEKGNWELRCYQGSLNVLGIDRTIQIYQGDYLLEGAEPISIQQIRSKEIAIKVEKIRKKLEEI